MIIPAEAEIALREGAGDGEAAEPAELDAVRFVAGNVADELGAGPRIVCGDADRACAEAKFDTGGGSDATLTPEEQQALSAARTGRQA